MKISDKLLSRENNFDFLRFFAASLVVFSHSYVLFGVYGEEPLGKLSEKETFGSIAVIIFFVMSGFLIGKSWIEKPKLLVFIWNRFLRIFPGFIVAILFTVFIIGPVVTTLDVKSYFENPKTLEYIKGMSMFFLRFELPGVFDKNIYPISVNGSLWTLPMELLMYAGVLFLGLIGVYKSRWIPAFLTGVLLVFNLLFLSKSGLENEQFLGISILTLFKFGGYFAIGLCAFVYNKHIKLNKWVALALLIVWVFSFKSSFMDLIGYIALPYVVLFIAFSKIKYINRITRYGDFSYGMYIYAFPIQQTLMHFYGGKISFLAFFFAAYVLTLIMGIISWHLVESRALKLKKITLVPYKNRFILWRKNFLTNFKFRKVV